MRKVKKKIDFKKIFSIRLFYFFSITKVIKSQYNAQRNLKKSSPPNHVYVHMDFSEACTCPTEEKNQEYWTQIQVTIQWLLLNSREMINHVTSLLFPCPTSWKITTPRLVTQFKELIPELRYISYLHLPGTNAKHEKEFDETIVGVIANPFAMLGRNN